MSMLQQNFAYPMAMLVDDNRIEHFILERAVQELRFCEQLINFATGDAALKYLERNCKDHQRLPQVIMVDINMPGMNGFEFISAMMQLPETTLNICRIVMISSSVLNEELQRANEHPLVKLFISKPLDRLKLAHITEVIPAIPRNAR